MADGEDILQFPGASNAPEPAAMPEEEAPDIKTIINECLQTPYIIEDGTKIDFPVLLRSLNLMNYILEERRSGNEPNSASVESLATGDLSQPISDPRSAVKEALMEMGEYIGTDKPPTLFGILFPKHFPADAFWEKTSLAILEKAEGVYVPVDLLALLEQSEATIAEQKLKERSDAKGFKVFDGEEPISTATSQASGLGAMFWQAIDRLGSLPGVSRIFSP